MAWFLAIAGFAAALVGLVLGNDALAATGVVTGVWSFLVEVTDHEGIRGALAFLGVPIALAAAVLAA